ncbi:MAG: hypothetical protein JWQ79_3286 [Mucilaginibacter sp.]|nr:hypothetical protein [Mucilaginibacter sp.]
MAYNDAITDLEQKLFSFNPQAEKIYNVINDLKSFMPTPAIKETSEPVANDLRTEILLNLIFNKDAAATYLVTFAIVYNNKLVKVKDIENTIKKFHPTFDKVLSTPLYKLKEGDIIDTYNPTGSNHKVYYGMKEWFTGENAVKEEYLTKEIEYETL